MSTIHYPDTSTVRSYNEDDIRLNTDGTNKYPDYEYHSGLTPYSGTGLSNINTKSRLLNLRTNSIESAPAPAVSIERTFNSYNPAQFTNNSVFIQTTHSTGCKGNATGLFSNVVSSMEAIGTYTSEPDSIGIHSRVLKTSASVNNAFSFWGYGSRASSTASTVKGALAGFEIDLFNAWSTNDATRNAVNWTSISGNSQTVMRRSYEVDNFEGEDNWTTGGWISGSSDDSTVTGMMDAALMINCDNRTGLPCWSNGILFTGNDSASHLGAIDPDYGVCINMTKATPKYNLKFGLVNDSHIYSSAEDLKIRVGTHLFTFGTDGTIRRDNIIIVS